MNNQYTSAYTAYLQSKVTPEIHFAQSLAATISVKGAAKNILSSESSNPQSYKISGYTEHFATIEQAVARLYEDMNDVNQLMDAISNLDQVLINIITMLKNNTGSVNATLASGLQTQVKSLKERMTILQGFLIDGKIPSTGVQFRENGTIYYNVHDLQQMYSRTLKANLALFAEKLATTSIQTDAGVNLISKKLDKEIKGTIRSFQKSNGLLQTSIKTFVEQNKNHNANMGHWSARFGSNLTDIRLVDSGAKITYNISQKQYASIGSKATQFHGLKTNMRRILLYLQNTGRISVDGFWAIIRAIAAQDFPSPELKKALISDTWIQAVFGEGNDQITDFLINGTLIPAVTVYDELKNHQDFLSLSLGKYSSQNDDKEKFRTTEIQSTKYFLNYLSAKAAADVRFDLSFKLNNNLFKIQ